ncbi:MAG: hypothetical protein FJW24_00390 [Acidimicrobiia bacterium]|nr:hypothetical protein [Acidimicrobiia bacterium]
MAARKRRFGCGAVLAATIVAGCARVSMPSVFDACEPVPAGAFDAVDWNAARLINVRVRHGEFQPSLIRLYQDRPYVMRIENRDSTSRRFQASGFLAAVHIQSITRSSGPATEVSCPYGISVAPREVVEVRFIAARDGRYEYRDDFLPFMFGGIPDGIVHIEAPPMFAALMPPAIPGITKPADDIPVGPYAPASVPVVPPAPEAPSPAEPAAMPAIPPAPETPAMPTEPSALPVPMPAPEAPPAVPTEPVTLPVPLPAPETPSATEPATAPVIPPAPETPAMPTEPSALPVPMPAPQTPAMSVEPSAFPIAPPAPETPPAAEPAAPIFTLPPPAIDRPRPLAPEHAPGNIPPRPGGVGLFGQ